MNENRQYTLDIFVEGKIIVIHMVLLLEVPTRLSRSRWRLAHLALASAPAERDSR